MHTPGAVAHTCWLCAPSHAGLSGLHSYVHHVRPCAAPRTETVRAKALTASNPLTAYISGIPAAFTSHAKTGAGWQHVSAL